MKTNLIFIAVLLLSIAALVKNFNAFKCVPRGTPIINFKNYSYENEK